MTASEPTSESLIKFVASSARADAAITILVVDDDEDCRCFLRDAISECDHKHNVVECGDGLAALEYLFQHGNPDDPARPALIFLDVEMPRKNGVETLQALKADPRFADIPVVMMTGVADEAVIRQTAALGANSYTIKPAKAEEFLKTVITSTNYWLTVHQYPTRHRGSEEARR